MLDVDNYQGVDTDEEDELKKPKLDYPAPVPPAAAVPAAIAPPETQPPAAPDTSYLAPKPVQPPPRPGALTAQDYAAAQPHGWRKALGALAVGAAGWHNPEAGKMAEQEVFEEPVQRMQQQRAGEQQAYDTELQRGIQQRAETRAEEAGQAENKLKGAQTEAAEQGMNMVTVTDRQGNTYRVPEKALGALESSVARGNAQEIVGEGRNQSAQAIAEGKNETEQKLARERLESAERIATGRNLVSTENARIRAASADDPNKLTTMMKTQKQQAQATLPQIDKALDETEKIAGKLGPVEGRWNDFWQGKVGANDPDYAHYKDEIGMISTAVTLAHARGRMSNELFEHFQKMFDAGRQAPENMIQALNVAKEWLGTYANMGEPGSAVSGGGNTPQRPKGVPDDAKWDEKRRVWYK